MCYRSRVGVARKVGRRQTHLLVAHGRKNHFITPGRDRIEMLFSNPAFPKDPLQRASRLIDLYIVSVLLDAGAGPDWSYTEKEGGEVVWQGGRSEGLAVASWHMFLNGVFSSDKASPLQVDGEYTHYISADLTDPCISCWVESFDGGEDGRTFPG